MRNQIAYEAPSSVCVATASSIVWHHPVVVRDFSIRPIGFAMIGPNGDWLTGCNVEIDSAVAPNILSLFSRSVPSGIGSNSSSRLDRPSFSDSTWAEGVGPGSDSSAKAEPSVGAECAVDPGADPTV